MTAFVIGVAVTLFVVGLTVFRWVDRHGPRVRLRGRLYSTRPWW